MLWIIPRTGFVRLIIGPGLEVKDLLIAEESNILTIPAPTPLLLDILHHDNLRGVLQWTQEDDGTLYIYFSTLQCELEAEMYLKREGVQFTPYKSNYQSPSRKKRHKMSQLTAEYSYGLTDNARIIFKNSGYIEKLPTLNSYQPGAGDMIYFKLNTRVGVFACIYKKGSNHFSISNPGYYTDLNMITSYFRDFEGFQKVSLTKYINIQDPDIWTREEQEAIITQELITSGLDVTLKYKKYPKEFEPRTLQMLPSFAYPAKLFYNISLKKNTKEIVNEISGNMGLPEMHIPPNFSKYDNNLRIRNKLTRIPRIDNHKIHLKFPVKYNFRITGAKYVQLRGYWLSIIESMKEKYKEIDIQIMEESDSTEEGIKILLRSEQSDIFNEAVKEFLSFLRGITIRITEFLSQAIFWHQPMKQMLLNIINDFGLICELSVPKINIFGPQIEATKAIQEIKTMIDKIKGIHFLKFRIPPKRITLRLEYLMRKRHKIGFIKDVRGGFLYANILDNLTKGENAEELRIIIQEAIDSQSNKDESEEGRKEDECGVCYCNIEKHDIQYQFRKCKCSLHEECLMNMVEHFLNPGEQNLEVKCPKCGVPLDIVDIKLIFNDYETNTTIKRYLLESYIKKYQNKYRFCVIPDCSGVFKLEGEEQKEGRTGQFKKCSSCGNKICTMCWQKGHKGRKCECNICHDNYHGNTPCTVNDQLLEQLNIKKCPKCKGLIEKMDGCNHIKCHFCHTHFCFKCAQFYSEEQGDIYKHMTEVHGNIGLGEIYM